MTIPVEYGPQTTADPFFRLCRSDEVRGTPRNARPALTSFLRLAAIMVAVFACSGNIHGQSAPLTKISDPIPYGQKPIDYWEEAVRNPCRKLEDSLRDGQVTLRYQSETGHLDSLLKLLEINPSSQLLVFSKTARNQHLIDPSHPRAIYFSDDVMVAWVPGAASLEIAVWDDDRGFVFLTLSQRPREDEDHGLSFGRDRNCLACHAGSSTLHVPGLAQRSFQTRLTGAPVEGYREVDQTTEFTKRWAGWYVTGSDTNAWHLGNRAGLQRDRPEKRVETAPAAALPQDVLAVAYPEVTSDVVAHLVFDHQVRCSNLIARVFAESKLGKLSDAEDRLVDYLLFKDEQPLEATIDRSSEFRRHFESRGERHPESVAESAKRRTLRSLNLRSRVFEHPLSFMVETRPFHSLPRDAQRRVGEGVRQRLLAAGHKLSGSNPPLDGQISEFEEALTNSAKRMPDAFRIALLGK